MFTSIFSRLKNFRDDTSGTVSAEAAMVFPFVMWVFVALYTFFDAYQQNSVNQKASYTIADMLSRETNNINPTYMDNAKELFDSLADTSGNTSIRVSVIRWSQRHSAYRVDWSETRGNANYLQHADVLGWETKLPTVPDQERVVLVETWSQYNPPFNVGLPSTDLNTFVFTRLRFAPQLKWSNT